MLLELFSKLGNQFRCLLVGSFPFTPGLLEAAAEAAVEAVVSVFCWKDSRRLLTKPVVASAMPFCTVMS